MKTVKMNISNAKTYAVWVIMGYISIDILRIHDFFPYLKGLKPGIIMTIIITCYMLYRARDLQVKSFEAIVFLILLSVMALNVTIAINNYHAYQIFSMCIIYYLVFICVISFITELSDFKTILDFWSVAIIILAILGIASGGKIDGSSIMEDENDFCLCMNMTVPILFFRMLNEKARKVKIFFFIGLIIVIAASVFTLSRGGFIGLSVALGYCMLRTKRKIAAAGIFSIVILTVLLIAPSQYLSEIESIESQNYQSGTGAARLYYWNLAIEMFKSNPIFGVGQGNFPWRVHEFEPPEGFGERSHAGMQCHSIYFTAISELGLAGLILITLLIIKAFNALRFEKSMHNTLLTNADLSKIMYSNGMYGALICFFITGAFISVLYYPYMWFFIGLCLALSKIKSDIVVR